MRTNVTREIGELLDEAEAKRACLLPKSDRIAKAVKTRCENDELVQVFPRLYARSSWWDGLPRDERDRSVLRTLCSAKSDLVVCGRSAALAHGLSVHYNLRNAVHIASSYHAVHGCMEHHEVPLREVEVIDGIRCTPLRQSLFECVRDIDFRRGLAVADSALAKSGLEAGEMAELIRAEEKGRKGVRRCIKLLGHANGLSENGGESVARAVMIEQGFMVPELQVEIPGMLVGEKVRRVDFFWLLEDGSVILGELDGKPKYIDEQMTHGRTPIEVMTAERIRESRLTRVGRVMRFGYNQVIDVPGFCALLESFGVPRVREPWDPLA